MESSTQILRNELRNFVKTVLHFSIFFTMGFIAAFVRWDTTILDSPFSNYNHSNTILNPSINSSAIHNRHNSTGLHIVITTIRSNNKLEITALTRLAHSLVKVTPPLLWVVVEANHNSMTTIEILRGTKIMYRHLTYKETFTDLNLETDHQRNIALRHLERHRMEGIVHFADPSIIYDLSFFEEIRKIKSFGAWPVASVGLNRRRVMVEGPVCQDSKIVGWFSKDASSRNIQWISTMQDVESNPPKINVYGFGFDSSILWDHNRSSRTKSTTNTTEGFLKFVLEEATKEEANLKGIPSDCSRVMLWHLSMPRSFVHPSLPRPNS